VCKININNVLNMTMSFSKVKLAKARKIDAKDIQILEQNI
jgi:hypothetical protein